jgi:glucose/arabinose dehydrogenase
VITLRRSAWGVAATLVGLATGCASDSSGVAVTFVTAPGSGTSASASASPDTTVAITESSLGEPSTTPTAGTAPIIAQPNDLPVTLTQLGSFQQPVGMSWRPSDGTLYVVEQDGRVVIMNDGQPGAVALDMTDLTGADGERGLLGLAINLDGSRAYVDYTDNDGNTEIDEYAVSPDGTFDPSTRRKVLAFDQPYPNHNGGDLVFGPDHLLYIGTGDGGGAGDQDRRALDLGQLLGKMLRIDPQATSSASYTVPPDNPFVGVAGARPEIWSVGLRNPWRFSFDRATDDLWIADVGQNQWEEVDVAWAADGDGRGMNFGWSAFEGTHRFNDDQSPDGATPPIYEYEHGPAGCSISGGARYRGAAIPTLVGWYVYADYCSGQVRALKIEGRALTGDLTLGTVASVSAVTEGPDGELFVLSVSGPIYAVAPA